MQFSRAASNKYQLYDCVVLIQAQPTVAKAGLAAGAVGVAALVLFQEASTVVELVGAATAGAFLLPRFLRPGSGTESGTRKQVRYGAP